MYQSLMVPGKSGNPNGRPKKVITAQELFERKVKKDVKAAARDYSAEALQTLIDIMRNPEVQPQIRVTAANSILDRGHGKPVNQTEISVGLYDKLSDLELVKFISGVETIEGEVLSSMDDDQESSDEYEDSGTDE